jgi:hypothetical protein
MKNERNLRTERPDPAAVFACATSLRDACRRCAEADPHLNLSECYNGMDEFMRVLMRVANLFESWACERVAFENITDVWPYLLEDKFGDACLESIPPSALARFGDEDCLRVALRLRFPIRMDDKLPVPIDVRAPNPIGGSVFREFRIQTVRDDDEGEAAPFTTDDDPFDNDFGPPYFALYGVGDDGLLEHIAYRDSYSSALDLARKLAPGVALPLKPICFAE